MNETKALGMIEVYGRVADVEALDAALKAADTHLVSLSKVGGGLTTIFVEGEVAAVKASVEAGGAAADRVGKLVSTHVIPRPDPSVREMLRRDIQIPPSGTAPDGSNGPNGSVVPPEEEEDVPAPAPAVKAAPVQAAAPAAPIAKPAPAVEAAPVAKPAPAPAPTAEPAPAAKPAPAPAAKAAPADPELSGLTVSKLRQLARNTEGFPMDKAEIRFAKKDALLAGFSSVKGK